MLWLLGPRMNVLLAVVIHMHLRTIWMAMIRSPSSSHDVHVLEIAPAEYKSAKEKAVSQIYNPLIYMGYHPLAEKVEISVNKLTIRLRKLDMIVLITYKVFN